MRKIILGLLLMFSFGNSFAQNFIGLNSGNYAGLQGIILQPANVADSRYKFEINIIASDVAFRNNFVGFSRDFIFNNKFSTKDYASFADFKEKVLTENISKGIVLKSGDDFTKGDVYFNLDNRTQLPLSFMVSMGKNAGLALNMQSRTSFSTENLDRSLAKQIYEQWKYQPTQGTLYNTDGVNVRGLSWLEAGLTYGQVLYNKNHHFVKAAVTAKYLGGLSALYFDADQLSISATQDTFLNATAQNVGYGHNTNGISPSFDWDLRPDASSWGADFGVVYEYRGRIDKFKFLKRSKKEREIVSDERRDKNKYTLKVGASLLDVGMLKFKSVPLARKFDASINGLNLYNINVNNLEDFDTLLNNNVTFTEQGGQSFTYSLPTALSFQLDWHIANGFYLNALTYSPFNQINKKANYKAHTPSYVALTPRWESRRVGVYLPFMVNDKYQLNAGAALRLGPLFVGSGNMLTLFQKDNINNLNLYAGLKVPVAFGNNSKWAKKFDDFSTKITKGEILQTTKKELIRIDTIYIDTNSNKTLTDTLEKKSIEEKQQNQVVPINIIINNYHSSNGSGTQIITNDTSAKQTQKSQTKIESDNATLLLDIETNTIESKNTTSNKSAENVKMQNDMAALKSQLQKLRAEIQVYQDSYKPNTPTQNMAKGASPNYNGVQNAEIKKLDDQLLLLKSQFETMRNMNQNEIDALKNEIQRLKRNANKLSSQSAKVVPEQAIKIVHDTIVIEKPVEIEKVVTEIIRDTLTNTIERNNTITEIKEVNNDRDILLAAPPYNILFDVGQFYIKPIYAKRLEYYATQLKKFKDLKVLIEGHTDNTGNKEKNLILSNNRARAVSNYLINKGVSRDRILENGLGDEKPLIENSDPAAKSQNRRVDITIIE